MSDTDLSFSEIGKLGLAEIGEEKALPMGTYQFQIVKTKLVENQSTKENAPAADFVISARPKSAKDDVTPSTLEGINLQDEVVYHRITIFRRKDLHKVRRFAELVGVDVATGDVETWGKAMQGSTFLAYVKHTQNKNDPEGLPYVNLTAIGRDE